MLYFHNEKSKANFPIIFKSTFNDAFVCDSNKMEKEKRKKKSENFL